MRKIEIKNNFINAVFPDNFDINKYRNKKIIIVGGGPSTIDINWENLDFDYIFSCNQFYLCDKLKHKHVEIASLINRIFDEPLHDELMIHLNNTTYPSIEPYHSHKIYNFPTFQEFFFKYQNQCIFFDTVFQNKSGAAPRLALLAAALHPNTIYMVGIDGMINNTTKHSFDKHLLGPRDRNSLNDINNAHVEFSKYFYTLTKELNIKLFNLGEGHRDNASTEYSKANYPLTEELKKLIK
jgi:hypothetical protein